MTFKTQPLVGNRVLVRGSDSLGVQGQCVLNSTQWDQVKEQKQFSQATKEFDEAVEEFFRPLDAALTKLAGRAETAPDSATFVVLEEATEGTPHNPGLLIHLDHDAVCLRLLEQGAFDRLIWVDNILEVVPAGSVNPAQDDVPLEFAVASPEVVASTFE
jgi:hypothetical protein